MTGFLPVGGGAGAGFQLFTQSNNDPGIYADAAARDVYFGANPDELARLEENEFLIIKLLDNGSGEEAYQQRQASAWVDTTSLVQGETGEDSVDTSALGEGDTVRFNATTQKLEPAPANVDSATGEFTFNESVNVPAGSINVGEVLQLTEGIADLIVVDKLRSSMAFSVNTDFDDATGSSTPTYYAFSPPFVLSKQIDDSQVITDNPLTFSLTGTVVAPDVRLIDKITIRTNGPMVNFRAKLVDNSTGLTIRYIPSKAAYLGLTDGLTLGTGDIVFYFTVTGINTPTDIYLGYSPFIIEESQQIDFTVIGDSIDVLGNVGGIPYLVAEAHDGPAIVLGQDSHAKRVQATGILEGGVISQVSATTVDWTSGRGQTADYTNPESPVITDVTWSAATDYTPTNIATDGQTAFGFDSSGTLVERLITAVTIDDPHDIIWFGTVIHVSSTITGVITAPGNLGYDGITSFADFINLVIGPANVDGNIYGANGANMTIDVVGGNAYILGSNFRTDTTTPDIVTLASDTALSFVKMYRSAGAGLNMLYDGAPTTLIDPTQYDDGSGTLQTVGTNDWTIQRIFRSRAGATIVVYGQETFNTKALALEALGSEAFTEKSPLPLTLFRGSLVVSEAATNLSDTAEAEFFAQSSFRTAGAQSASSTIPGVTSPGGPDSSLQFNNAGAFGGDSNFLYDSTLKTVVLQSAAAGSATYEFVDSTDDVKGTIKYSEGADEFSIDALNGLSELHLNSVAYVHKGVNDGRIDIHAFTNAGSALLTLSNFAGGTGLSLEHDDTTDNSLIDSEIGSLTIQTSSGTEDIILSSTGSVGVNKPDPDSVFHIYENTTETGIQAGLTIEQDGSGDAITQYLLTGGRRWVTGIDNSGSDAYKIASSLDLGSNAQLVLETDGRSEFLGELGVNILPSSTVHVYEDTAEVGAAAGLTIEQDGTGDAVAQFLLTGGQRWVMGIDNTQDDEFCIASTLDLNSNKRVVLQTDGRNYFNGTLGIGQVPESGYRLDVLTSISVHTRLSTFKAVTIESGKNGSGNSTDFFFNRGNVGFNQSEFTMFNDNNASASARMFRMGYSDDIDTSGGLTVWKTRNNVAVGTYSLPDSVFTVSEDTTETGDQAGLTIIQEGAGDAIAQFLLDGGQRWVMGIDNSGNDAFKIASSINLGSDDMLVLEPDAGMFLYSHTDDVLTLGNSTGETSKISVDNAGSPEGAVTGTGGDDHINVDGVRSTRSLKKSASSSTADWYDYDLVPPNLKVIYNTTELEAMASFSVITISASTTWIIKGHLSSDVRVEFTNNATLHIVTDNSNQSSWAYTGTGTLFSGAGRLRALEFFDLIGSASATFCDLELNGGSVNLTLAGVFNWGDLGTINNGTLILDVSDIFDNVLGWDLFNCKITLTKSNITNTPTTALPFLTVDNSTAAVSKSISVDQMSGTFASGASLFRIEPALSTLPKNLISACIFGGGELFDISGSTGEFTIVADVPFAQESITSVTNSSGKARFNFTAPPTYFVGQTVTNSTFTETSYNGSFIISATGAGYYELEGVSYESGDTGLVDADVIRLTDIATTLADGNQIKLSTTGSTFYDNGYTVFNKQTDTFDVSKNFGATATGTWSTEGLDQTDSRILAQANPGFADSNYLCFGHIEENPVANATTISVADTYQAIDISGTTGSVTIFATNGAGGTTCTSATHGLAENQNIVLTAGDEYYRGTFTIFNVTTNTFDIAITFQSTVLTSTWTAGYQSQNERFKTIDPTISLVEYIGSEPFEGAVIITWSVYKSGSSEDYLFSSGKNGVAPEQGAAYQKRTVTTSTSVHPVTVPVSLIKGDTIQPILASVTTTNSITIENLQMEIS